MASGFLYTASEMFFRKLVRPEGYTSGGNTAFTDDATLFSGVFMDNEQFPGVYMSPVFDNFQMDDYTEVYLIFSPQILRQGNWHYQPDNMGFICNATQYPDSCSPKKERQSSRICIP